MSLLGYWSARLAQSWLERFRLRHELGSHTAHPLKAADTGPALVTESERVLLHVGCGPATIDNIPVAGFRSSAWREIRFDADRSVQPDIIGTMVDMSTVPAGFADAIYSSHNIEHLYPHEVPLALAEFVRALKPDGFLLLTCPDLQSLCRLVVENKLDDPAYFSPAGPIAPIDVLYGHRPAMAAGNLFMAHHCGFTVKTLMIVLREAGFAVVHGLRRPGCFDLWVLASKSPRSPDDMAALAQEYLLPSP